MQKDATKLDKYRQPHPTLGASKGMFGFFVIPNGRHTLRIVSSGEIHEGTDWEHVSISKPYDCPTWEEMCMVKALFWGDDETVIQFHPQKTNYKNVHPYCLHLWRHKDGHQLPPDILV